MVQFYKVKKRYVLRAGILMGVVLIVISLVLNSLRINEYKIRIAKIRSQKDAFFKESENSPIVDKENFRGLEYYPVKTKYKVKAVLNYPDTLVGIKILRNDGKLTWYDKIAYATFSIDNIEHKVVLLKLRGEEEGGLFLPFTDMTNGKETYKAGRYIDLEYKDRQKTVEIDFNLAYNPYCVYNYKYSCPIPPRENFIGAEILAGEKLAYRPE